MNRTSRRTVACAIVNAAAGPPGFALGAGGWSVGRVERLLAPPPRRRLLTALAVAVIVLALAVVVQTVGHAVAGVHLAPVAFPVP